MHATNVLLSDHSTLDKPTPITVFGRIWDRIWPIAFVLVILTVEVGWVTLLGYGLVYLFS
jgi:hypothetical protein